MRIESSLFISQSVKEKQPTIALVSAVAATSNFSNTLIIPEAQKDTVVEEIRRGIANNQRRHLQRHVWRVSKADKGNFDGISNDMPVKTFAAMVTAIDQTLSFTGLGGR